MYNQWCKCQRMLLTTGEIEAGLPCEACQKEEHAKDFPEKFKELGKEKGEEECQGIQL